MPACSLKNFRTDGAPRYFQPDIGLDDRRVTSESAHMPSWGGDSRHVLYQTMDKLRIVDVETMTLCPLAAA